MKAFTHAVVRTVGDDGRARSMLLDVETASMLTEGRVTQMVSKGPPGAELPKEIEQIFSWDLGGMKAALAEAEARGLLHAESSLEEIQKYLDEYQLRHSVDFGLPKLI